MPSAKCLKQSEHFVVLNASHEEIQLVIYENVESPKSLECTYFDAVREHIVVPQLCFLKFLVD